jgi:hypothetical protein
VGGEDDKTIKNIQRIRCPNKRKRTIRKIHSTVHTKTDRRTTDNIRKTTRPCGTATAEISAKRVQA